MFQGRLEVLWRGAWQLGTEVLVKQLTHLPLLQLGKRGAANAVVRCMEAHRWSNPVNLFYS